MIDLHEFIWSFSLISLLHYFLRGLKKAISMASLTIINFPIYSSSRLLSSVGEFFIGQEETRQEISPPMVSQEEKSLILHEKNPNVVKNEGSNSLENTKVGNINTKGSAMKVRKRPAKLVVPEFSASLELYENERKLERKEFEVEGRDFLLACKRGRREVMEDGYGFMLDIHGDPKQAFFTVIDGHGGRAAAEYVAGNLGRNIVKELGNIGDEGVQLEQAMRVGYQVTDKEFLSQGVTSGACTASVLLKDSELHVANAGDCRVVLSRNGVADSLTKDHRLSREDERSRIENAGAFVHFCNGAWRVQGSLAVSRAIGDLHLKEWIISEPETKGLSLTSDCEFLIMASDGLWDKVNAQEAVDVVSRNKSSMESCKKLIDISSSRGNMDDITVMVINLDKFVPKSH